MNVVQDLTERKERYKGILEELEQHLIHNNWLEDAVPAIAQSLFTSYVYLTSFDYESATCNGILSDIYINADIESVDLTFSEFKEFMLEIVKSV